MLRLPSFRCCVARQREMMQTHRLHYHSSRSIHLTAVPSPSLSSSRPRAICIGRSALSSARPTAAAARPPSATSQPFASFATRSTDKGSQGGDKKGQEKKGSSDTAAGTDAAAGDADSSSASPAPAPVKGKEAAAPSTVSLTRADMEKAGHVLSSSPPPAPSRPPPVSSRPSAAALLSTALSTPSDSSLRIPLLPGSDVVDPSIAVLVRRSSPDDLVKEQLIDTHIKLVATPAELSVLLQKERLEERSIRAYRRTALRGRRSVDDRVKFAGEEMEYVYAIDDQNENEELMADNPESMRRRHAIDLKQIRLNVRERLMELEEGDDSEKDWQTAEAERERQESAQRLLRLESGEEAQADAADDTQYDPMRRVREEEAQEALEAARLRENAVFKYREDFGEREGDDFPFEEEERLYEQDDRPRRPPLKRENIKARLRPREVDLRGRSFGYGGRKSSTAQVWLQPGTGDCRVNHLQHAEYFIRHMHRACLLRPFEVVDRMGVYDVRAFTSGGGKTGQSGAIQLGIARALVKQEPLLRERLKEEGLLTRDARKVERKKPGQPKARKKYTFIKR